MTKEQLEQENAALVRENASLRAELENERARELKHRIENQSLRSLLKETREWIVEVADFSMSVANHGELDKVIERVNAILGVK